MEGKESKVSIVGKIADEIRICEVPALKALRLTQTARSRIEKAGWECLSFDQLALRAHLGQNTFLLEVLRTPKRHESILVQHLVCYTAIPSHM
uniref:Large ribosomal subunit protein uL15/eL18 domain-containing protein n=1 Tax=Cucumis sativus TaxID=3659 RepID=A0A0A0L0N3_CUCSA